MNVKVSFSHGLLKKQKDTMDTIVQGETGRDHQREREGCNDRWMLGQADGDH